MTVIGAKGLDDTQLPDIRATAQHDWGQTVGSESGFHEFVTIDRRSCELALIVASDD